MARWVGDFFNCGIYDSHILIKKTPFLEREPPRQLDKLIAGDVMCSSSERLSYLFPITRVRSIERLLRTTSHSAFPVAMPVDFNTVLEFPTLRSQQIPQLYQYPKVLKSESTRDVAVLQMPEENSMFI